MNLQIFQNLVFVEQLVALGVDTACIVSGSRSTPLSLAFVSHSSIQSYAFVDERGAAFFALGRAKLTEKPVVVICTSGTAAANFLPAICEAKEIGVSLIVLTADRPHELRISGSNQTMDQIKLFGDRVHWFADVVTLQDREKSETYAKFVALQAVKYCQSPKGPIHLNFPFRKPLEPNNIEEFEELRMDVHRDFQPLTLSLGYLRANENQVNLIQEKLDKASRIMIILGPDSDRYVNTATIKDLVAQDGIIVVSDALSGFKYQGVDDIVTCMDVLLQLDEIPTPDLILQVGEMPISKYLGLYLDSYRHDWIVCSPLSKLTDGVLKSTWNLQISPLQLLQQLDFSAKNRDVEWSVQVKGLSKIFEEKITKNITNLEFEALIIRNLINLLKPDRLWIANSLAVRHFDEFIPTLDNQVKISSQRGVSGIDGTLSTALGTASVEPTVLITGDLAFYHDLNALLIMQRYQIPLIVIVINNHGGAIFERLPISEFTAFDEYFYNEHTLAFDKIAEQFGIDHILIPDAKSWESHSVEISEMKKKGLGIIEIHTPKGQEDLRQEILKSLRK